MLTSVLSLLSLAQAATPEEPRQITSSTFSRKAVLFDLAEDGTLYAKGRDYKMIFDADGAQFIPALGPKAPRNLPLKFRFHEATRGSIVRNGDRVTIDRGTFDEVYRLEPGQVEQLFVVKQRPGTGDLLFRMKFETELHAADVDDGLEFRAPGLGKVSYGDATIFDAATRSVSVRCELEGDAIAIRIPASFVASATFPLTIDPILTSGGIDGGISTTFSEADAAANRFTASFNSFAIVHTEFTSATDRDIVVERIDDNFVSSGETAIDISTDDTFEPAVGASTQNFLVAFTRSGSLFAGSAVRARTLSSTGIAGASILTIASGPVGLGFNQPDVGGGGSAAVGSFVVAYRGPANGGDIFARQVSETGVLGTAQNITSDLPTDQNSPSVSEFDENNEGYFIAFRTGSGGAGSQIQAYPVDENGVRNAFITPTNISNVSTLSLGAPTVAGNGTEFGLFWTEETSAGNFDVMLKRRTDLPFSLTNGPILNLSAVETGVTASVSQRDVAASFDGTRFIYAYMEPNSFVGSSIFAAVVQCTALASPFFYEGHVIMTPSSGDEALPTVAAGAQSDTLGRSIIAFQRTNFGFSTLDGVLFDSLSPGGVVSLATGCSAAIGSLAIAVSPPQPPAVGNSNFAITGGVNASGAQLWVGIPLVSPIALCPGQGTTCALGVNPILMLPMAGGSLNLPIPMDPVLKGFTAGMQAVKLSSLLPGQNPFPACGPPKFTTKVDVSNTLLVTFQ